MKRNRLPPLSSHRDVKRTVDLTSRLEAASDGVIDIKLDETTEEARSMMRIRAMRNAGFDARWHRLKIGDHSEVSVEK